jgi:tRNA(adenine34) deaminase
MNLSQEDVLFFKRAIDLALAAEKQGNLPVGAVITLDGRIISEGQNAIWQPNWSPKRHAEIEALHTVPDHLWDRASEMTLYTTLEPCLMCLGTILLYRIGRVLYGASDRWGGASGVAGHMPDAFEQLMSGAQWLGPVYARECDPLSERVLELVRLRRDDDESTS